MTQPPASLSQARKGALAAELVTATGVPLPAGGKASFVTLRDGAHIRIGTWRNENARSSVIVLPGATEFIEQYGETIGELLARNQAVGIFDWRGQGLSDRPLADLRKRHIDSFETYVEDFREVAARAFADLPQPWILLCQSMGGNIGALILSRHIVPIAGAVLMTPMLGINTAPWPQSIARLITAAACRTGLQDRYIPGGGAASDLAKAFKANTLTHDPERFGRTHTLIEAEPRLDIGSPTFGWLAAAFASMDALARPGIAEAIDEPVLIFTASEDVVVLNGAIARFAARIPKARLVELAEARHAILLERPLVRAAFWRDYDAFAARLVSAPGREDRTR